MPAVPGDPKTRPVRCWNAHFLNILSVFPDRRILKRFFHSVAYETEGWGPGDAGERSIGSLVDRGEFCSNWCVAGFPRASGGRQCQVRSAALLLQPGNETTEDGLSIRILAAVGRFVVIPVIVT